jgi:hypothetical protein
MPGVHARAKSSGPSCDTASASGVAHRTRLADALLRRRIPIDPSQSNMVSRAASDAIGLANVARDLALDQ